MIVDSLLFEIQHNTVLASEVMNKAQHLIVLKQSMI